MGCWYKTCGLSNLHIRPGEDVYVFALEQARRDTDRCYTTAFWRPLMLPFYSKYNDYGGGEDSSGPALPYIIEGIQADLIEMEVGKNEYHDIAVKKEGFTDKEFFESVHKHRLKITDYMGGEQLIDFVMLRKDVVDGVLDTWEIEKYVGDGKGTGGWGNCYIYYKFADVLADIPAFLDRIEEDLKSLEGTTIRTLLSLRGLEHFADWKGENKVGWWVQFDSHRYSNIIRPNQLILDLMVDGNRTEAETILIEHLKACFIDAFYDICRRVWIPAGHEGSQANELSGYRVLINQIEAAITREENERGED